MTKEEKAQNERNSWQIPFATRVDRLKQNMVGDYVKKNKLKYDVKEYKPHEIFPQTPKGELLPMMALGTKIFLDAMGKTVSGAAGSIKNMLAPKVSAVSQSVKESFTPGPTLKTPHKSAPSPTPTMMPRPITTQKRNRFDPEEPQNIPKTWYTNRTVEVDPEMFDEIESSGMSETNKRYAMALGTQESGAGKNLVGDNGKSFGLFHIQPGNEPRVPGYGPVTKEQALNKKFSVQFLKDFIDQQSKKVATPSAVLRRWNPNSGYINNGPKYDKDIPEMATTSSFIRGRK